MKERRFFLLAAMVLITTVAWACTPGVCSADVRKGALELGGFGGVYIMEGNQWLRDAPIVGGRFGYLFTREWEVEMSVGLSFSQYQISNNGFVPPGAPTFSEILSGRDADLYHYRAEVLYNFTQVGDKFVPFLGLGGGMVLLSGYDLNQKVDPEFTAAMGMKIFVTEDVALRADVRYVLLFDKWIKQEYEGYNRVHQSGNRFNNLEMVLGVSYLFGGKAADDDVDGVLNSMDDCPDTPAGVVVDSKGCPIDSDQDGVFDGIDQCPDTPHGVNVDNRGCPFDSDGDGVVDGLDQCPDTTEGIIVNDQGCPLDSDGDGVPDSLDKCPDTMAGVEVDANGCKVVVGIVQYQMTKKGLAVLGISFGVNSASIQNDSFTALDEVGGVLCEDRTMKIEIGGHTDSTGAASYNLKLSLRRAESVMRYLLGRTVQPGQMTVRGYGEAQPIAPNGTAEGRAKNRRIEFKVISE